MMTNKILVTVGVAFYLIVIPYLEWNHSHVFNPHWPPHARFHEVWQLFTHAALGTLALWLAWRKNQVRYAALISCCVMGGVLVSGAFSDHFGGSVQSGNLVKQVMGLDLAMFVALVIVASSMFVAIREK